MPAKKTKPESFEIPVISAQRFLNDDRYEVYFIEDGYCCVIEWWEIAGGNCLLEFNRFEGDPTRFESLRFFDSSEGFYASDFDVTVRRIKG